MGSGETKRNNKHSDTHSYNRPQSDPPGELHKAVINSISGQNKKRKDIILAVKNLIKDLTVFILICSRACATVTGCFSCCDANV